MTKAKILNDKEESAERSLRDGLENLISGLGGDLDKRASSRFVNTKMISLRGNNQELEDMYRTDWMSGKIVDIIPEDMTREWRTFDGIISPELIGKLVKQEEQYQLRSKFCLAHQWSRLYGTAFIVMNIDDGQDHDKPLIISRIKKGGLKYLNPLDRNRIDNSNIVPVQDPLSPHFGMPVYYRIAETAVRIHHSRVLRFDAVRLPLQEFRQNNYNSDSVLARLYDSLTNFATVSNGAASMVYETNVDVLKVKGLMNYLQTAEGEAQIRKRVSLASMMKSFNQTLLLDAEEDLTTKKNSFAGIPDLLDRYALFLSGASDIPSTRLLGRGASGLNATGEGDLKNYYDHIRSLQYSLYKPQLDYFDQIMAKSMGLPDDADLSYSFSNLFQMRPNEQANKELVDAQRDQIYLANGVVGEDTVAKQLVENKVYTNIEADDIKELEEVNNELGTNIQRTENSDQSEFKKTPEKASAANVG